MHRGEPSLHPRIALKESRTQPSSNPAAQPENPHYTQKNKKKKEMRGEGSVHAGTGADQSHNRPARLVGGD